MKLINPFFFFKILKKRKGVLLIEFAMVLPIFIILGAASYEVYKISNAKYFLKHSLYSLAIGISKDASTTNIAQSLQLFITEGAEYGLADHASFIITGLETGDFSSNQIKWVRDSQTYGLTTQPIPTTVVSSSFPALSDPAKFSYPINTIIIEVSYYYLPGIFFKSGGQFREHIAIDYRGANFPAS